MASAFAVDATDADAVGAHLDHVEKEHGRIDISFNLIGVRDNQGTPLTEMSLEAIARLRPKLAKKACGFAGCALLVLRRRLDPMLQRAQMAKRRALQMTPISKDCAARPC